MPFIGTIVAALPLLVQTEVDPELWRPNILLIVADDVGVDVLASYDEGDPSNYPSTPTIDALASDGLLFRNAYGNPLCSPTRATLLTGRYCLRNTVGGLVKPQSGGGCPNPSGVGFDLPLCEVTIPEALDAAYATAAIGKWHLTDDLVPTGPVDHGFGYFAGTLTNISNYSSWPKVVHAPPSSPVTSTETAYATTDNVDDAIAWIQGRQSPWFVYLAFNSAHVPIHNPPSTAYCTPANGLNGMIEAMDCEIGRLIGAVDPYLSSTMVVFVGDNGTDGAVYPPTPPALPNPCNGPVPSMRPGKRSFYEGGINVPLIVAGPLLDQSGESDSLVNTTDVFATVLEMSEVATGLTIGQIVPGVTLDSVSLLPEIRGQTPNAREYAFAELFAHPQENHCTWRPGVAVRNDRYKLIFQPAHTIPGGPCLGASTAMYDLQDDPFELCDLLAGTLTSTQLANFYELRDVLTDLDPPALRTDCNTIPTVTACQ